MFWFYRFLLNLILLGFLPVSAIENLGVNLSANEGAGARYAGLANTFLGFRGDETSGAYFPAALNDHDNLTVNIDYMQKFGLINYNHFSCVLPYHLNSTLSIGFSRVSVAGIEKHSGINPLFPDEGIIDIADYLFTGAIARRWGALDIGGSLHFIFRKLDQNGMGIRGDISGQYRFLDKFYLGLLLKGAVPASVRWQSEYFEYSPPDLYAGVGLELPSEYFYGVFRIAVQTKGLFQKEGKSKQNLLGGRIQESPADIVKTSSAGLEYQLNFGLNLRFGLSGLGEQAGNFYPAFGAGYNYKNFLNCNYSFIAHPDLLSTHRISFSVSPWFKKEKFQRPRQETTTAPAPESGQTHTTQKPQERPEQKSRKLPNKETPSEESLEEFPVEQTTIPNSDESVQPTELNPSQSQEEKEELEPPEELE
jgi:hypothetical protein